MKTLIKSSKSNIELSSLEPEILSKNSVFFFSLFISEMFLWWILLWSVMSLDLMFWSGLIFNFQLFCFLINSLFRVWFSLSLEVFFFRWDFWFIYFFNSNGFSFKTLKKLKFYSKFFSIGYFFIENLDFQSFL